MTETRRDPEALLSLLKEEERKSARGKLKIFFGATAGVGKTYAMLRAAAQLKEENVDVVVGYVETHGRLETEALLKGLEIIEPQIIDYKGTKVREFNIDEALKRKAQVILVDELAHTNAPGSRHLKRWQDVQELLESGIDVFTTLNVQHVESLNDLVAQITKVSVRERVPDFLLENADEIELVDLPPDELLTRLKEGKVYFPEQASSAMENFFRKGNLIALRELALRYTAERVVAEMEEYRQIHEIKHPWPATERILVCVSSSPLATRLVRAAKRMAEALRAKWTVVYVEGSMPLSHSHRESLVQTLRLAEQLGAEILELSGKNIAEEIMRCAIGSNVSKIIIGKPARPKWKEVLFGSIVDDVIRLSGVIDVYVISGDEAGAAPSLAARLQASSKSSAYFKALLQVLICTCLARAMVPYFELSNVIMTYLIGVVLVAILYGRGPSILSSLLSVAAFDFFCVPPFLTFAVSDTQYLVTFSVMLFVSLLISNLTVTIKQQAEAARLREMRTAALYSMSKELSQTLSMETLTLVGLRHISSVFDLQSRLLLSEESGQLKLLPCEHDKYELADQMLDFGIAAWVHKNKQMAGTGTDTLPGASALYLPLLGAKKNIGVLVVRAIKEDRTMSPEQLRLLETFANQLALACERAQLSEESELSRLQFRTEQLRSSLLSSVSHDLRTPLASISGAASSILEGSSALDLENCKEMVREIYDESMRLNRLVANLLDMTRLQSGTLKVQAEAIPVDEVIGTALSSMENRLADREVRTKVPEDIPFMAADAILIQQVLLNLVDNAVKYSPEKSPIEISAKLVNDMVEISVADQGPGIPDHDKTRVFEKFYRLDGLKQTGVGLGLAICAGIIEAHNGKIQVEDRIGGGTIFKFTIPSVKENPELKIQSELSSEQGMRND
ncbi:MAG: sensor histidine kinase KdpD [Candidatus Obscuribacterales bacterium]|nr:sensor histidine kinase KdpD [Candidatus Obscuribacterales bacterium]